MQAKKCIFYVAWTMNDSSIIASGLGYNGPASKALSEITPKWDRVVSIYEWEMDMEPSPAAKMIYWNHHIHLWLKHYVAGRLTKPGEKASFAAS